MSISKRFAHRAATAIAVLALVALPALARADGATLVSDKDDYAPGETAILTGAGFWPNELVDVSLTVDDPESGLLIADYAWVDVYADADGGFTAAYVVPPEALNMVLTATAMGLQSALTASVSFTDTHGTHNVNFATSGLSPALSITITGSRTNPGHNVATYSVTFTSPGPSIPNIGTQAGGGTSTVSYSGFPSGTFSNGTNTCTLVSTLPASGFATGAANQTTTVTATYSCVPACRTTNAAPTLAASDASVEADLCTTSKTVTVTPADFSAVASDAPENDPLGPVTFNDGSTSKTVTLSFASPSQTLTLKVTDSPPAQSGCPTLPGETAAKTVTLSATGLQELGQPTNEAPTISATNLNLPPACQDSLEVTVTPADFLPSTGDPDDDPVAVTFGDGTTSKTLTLTKAAPSATLTLKATDDPSGRDVGGCVPLAALSADTSVSVGATLYSNQTPTISAADVSLGELTGCLNGSFQKMVDVTPATFSPSAGDPDSDPVSVSLDVSSVTLVGPGMASANVTLTATDDPSSRTEGTCAAKSASTTKTVSAQIVYAFDGFGSPLSNTSVRNIKKGSTVPVKFRLRDCNGAEICTGSHSIGAAYWMGTAPNTAPDITDSGSSNDNGTLFRYSGTCGVDGQWIYNLQTKSGYYVGNTYRLSAIPNDGKTRTADINVTK